MGEIVRVLVESQPTFNVSNRLCEVLGVKPHVMDHDAETEASEDAEHVESLTPRAADAVVPPVFTETERKDSAHKLFKVVSGVLNGAFGAESMQVVSCQTEICI